LSCTSHADNQTVAKFDKKDLYTLFGYDDFHDILTSMFFRLNVANARKESEFRRCLISDTLSNKENDYSSLIINIQLFAVG
jgi:hypothetical protein